LPTAIKIDVEIVTWDPANYGKEGSNVTDRFTLEIYSNGESESDVCNFTTLVISNSLANKRFEYTIGGENRRRNLQYNPYDQYPGSTDNTDYSNYYPGSTDFNDPAFDPAN
jgi:hypothetical protein